MAQPTPYTPSAEFQELQDGPVGPALDTEFNDLNLTTDQILANLALIQRDDGRLVNASVHPETFASDAFIMFAGGSGTTRYVPRGAWVALRSYAATDLVTQSGITYVAALAHTSSALFTTDLAAGKWVPIAQVAPGFVLGGSYGAGTIVSYANNVYVARNAVNNAVTTPDLDTTNWSLSGGVPMVSGGLAVVATLSALKAVGATPPASILMLGYNAANDGGGGHFVWNAASTAVANDFTIVAVTGLAVGRYIAWSEGPWNLKRAGLVIDGVTDDSASFNNAITYFAGLSGQSAHFYLPQGVCLCNSTVDASGLINFMLEGDGYQPGGPSVGSVIKGSVAGDLIKYVPFGTGNSFRISKVSIVNTSTNASAASIHVENFVTGSLKDMSIGGAGKYGLNAPNNDFTLTIDTVKLSGDLSTFPNCILAYVSNHAHFRSVDVSGGADGIRIGGSGCSVSGARVEVCKRGIVLGEDAAGSSANSTACTVSAITMEANDNGMTVTSATACNINSLSIFGSVNAPSGQSKTALVVNGASGTQISDISYTGSFSDVAVRGSGGSGQLVMFENVRGNNTFTTRKWDVQGGLDKYSFRNCDYLLRPDDTVAQPSIQEDGRFQYLAQVDCLNPTKRGKNLRGINVPIAMGATSLAISFTGAGHGAGNAAINTATAGAVGGTLPAGTYYYLATVVTAHGETSGTGEKTVVIGGANNGTTIVFFANTADGFKRRIYRGTAPGVYDGYYETALNSNSNYVDTNAAFTGVKQPPSVGVDDTSMVEPDNTYEVQASVNFNAGSNIWITSKLTTGFTLNWATAAPAAQLADWTLIR